MEKLTGNGVVLNTSLNRRGEPMICSPTDALNMFYGSDLQYLIMQDILVGHAGAGARCFHRG
jgi:carbamoyltransferase